MTEKYIILTEKYIILNCEACGKPVVKVHEFLLLAMKNKMNYTDRHLPHFYHPDCPGGLENVNG